MSTKNSLAKRFALILIDPQNGFVNDGSWSRMFSDGQSLPILEAFHRIVSFLRSIPNLSRCWTMVIRTIEIQSWYCHWWMYNHFLRSRFLYRNEKTLSPIEFLRPWKSLCCKKRQLSLPLWEMFRTIHDRWFIPDERLFNLSEKISSLTSSIRLRTNERCWSQCCWSLSLNKFICSFTVSNKQNNFFFIYLNKMKRCLMELLRAFQCKLHQYVRRERRRSIELIQSRRNKHTFIIWLVSSSSSFYVIIFSNRTEISH